MGQQVANQGANSRWFGVNWTEVPPEVPHQNVAPPETFTDLQLASANTLSSFHLISSMRRRFCAALISHQANGGIERAISFVLQQTSAFVREASPPPPAPPPHPRLSPTKWTFVSCQAAAAAAGG